MLHHHFQQKASLFLHLSAAKLLASDIAQLFEQQPYYPKVLIDITDSVIEQNTNSRRDLRNDLPTGNRKTSSSYPKNTPGEPKRRGIE